MEGFQTVTLESAVGENMAGLESFPGIKVEDIKPQVYRFVFPDEHDGSVLTSGQLLNLGYFLLILWGVVLMDGFTSTFQEALFKQHGQLTTCPGCLPSRRNSGRPAFR